MKEILLGILGIFWCIFLGIFGMFYGILIIILIFTLVRKLGILIKSSLKKFFNFLIALIKSTLNAIHFCTKKSCDFIVEQNKMRKVLTIIMLVLMSLAIIGILYDAFMPSVMKYPHNLVQSFSSDVIENESNVLRRNINDTVENVNIDIKQSNENVEKKEDYIKKEYLDSATYSYNVINTISGILVPLFTFIALVVAYNTFLSQKKQLEIQEQQLKNQKQQNELSVFENHLFHMIEQQHKLEEKVVDKYGSFRELYEKFFKICFYLFYYVGEDFNEVVKGNDKRNEIGLKIANYIFYFGADKDFLCDKTFQILTGEDYGLDQKKLKAFIIKLIGPKDPKIEPEYYYLFHTQKSEELGIYYRNLFNAIRYIDWECPYDDEEKKKEYAKLVRTNLSDFAQLMLYYNMQGERGSAWLDKNEVKNPKGDENGYYYSKIKKDGKIKLVRVKDCLLTRYLPIKNCAISINERIDPRNDCRNEDRKALFSDDVIDYELKIGD